MVSLLKAYAIGFSFLATTPLLAHAISVQNPDCTVEGDSDIYGIGVRIGYYLQWASIVISFFTAPKYASTARVASIITTLAIYIVALRNMQQGTLVALDYPLLWEITTLLLLFNWPTTENSFKRHGGALAVMLLTWAIYYFASPWAYFKALDQGKQPNCVVYTFIFTPIDMNSNGFETFLKVMGVFGVFTGVLCIGGAIYFFGLWIENFQEDIEEDDNKPNAASMSIGFMALVSGPIAIAFTEMTLKINDVTFPGTSLTSTGQLIPFLIGIFTVLAAIVGALKNSMT